jgi:hypothetical protein
MSTTGASSDHEDVPVSTDEVDELVVVPFSLDTNLSLNLNSGNRMSREYLRRLCIQRKMYEHDLSLNEILYFQHQGFKSIENLDIFQNCVCLFLNNNCISSIDHLSFRSVRGLRQLYLNSNTIDRLAMDAFSHNPQLEYLNLSHNKLKTAVVLSPRLATMIIANNLISDLNQMLPLPPSLETLDFSGNPVRLEHEDAIITFAQTHFASLKQLCTPDLDTPHFRRRMTLALPQLMALDNFPITSEDRKLADAWLRGDEQAARKEISETKRNAMQAVLENFRKFQEDGVKTYEHIRRVKEENEMNKEDSAAKINAQLADDIRRILSN